MKTICLAGVEYTWTIRMPSVLFWFFKRLASVKSVKNHPDFNGIGVNLVVFDEADFK